MAFKYYKDEDIYNDVMNTINASSTKRKTKSSSSSSDDFLKQIDYYANNYAKQNLEIERQKE